MDKQKLEQWFTANKTLLESAYMGGQQPWQQSGFGVHSARTYEQWAAHRKPVAAAVSSSGTFLDSRGLTTSARNSSTCRTNSIGNTWLASWTGTCRLVADCSLPNTEHGITPIRVSPSTLTSALLDSQSSP